MRGRGGMVYSPNTNTREMMFIRNMSRPAAIPRVMAGGGRGGVCFTFFISLPSVWFGVTHSLPIIIIIMVVQNEGKAGPSRAPPTPHPLDSDQPRSGRGVPQGTHISLRRKQSQVPSMNEDKQRLVALPLSSSAVHVLPTLLPRAARQLSRVVVRREFRLFSLSSRHWQRGDGRNSALSENQSLLTSQPDPS